MLNKIKRFIADPVLRIYYLSRLGFYKDDRRYIEKKYRAFFGEYPDLDCPKTFNEKNNWRKLHDRKEIYTEMVDKYLVKNIIEERVGKDHMFKLLGVWNSANEIDFSLLPDKFVLKTNHSGGVIVCRDRKEFDCRKAVRELNIQLKKNYFIYSREWPYKNVKRKIICEEYMGENLTDFKNYCFNGEVYYTFVWENQSRNDGRKPEAYFCGAYDRNWNNSGIEINYPSRNTKIRKPDCYDEMIKVAQKMAKGIPFVRVDCYILDNHVYIGEMTFFPWGGFQIFKNPQYDIMLGNLERLPELEGRTDERG